MLTWLVQLVRLIVRIHRERDDQYVNPERFRSVKYEHE
jgi:hypothetical protein